MGTAEKSERPIFCPTHFSAILALALDRSKRVKVSQTKPKPRLLVKLE